SGINNIDPTQHLTNNHLNVLVIDLNPLEAIDVLDLVHNVASKFLDAFEAQNIVWVWGTIHNKLTFVHHLTVVHQYLLFFWNQEFMRFAIQVSDNETLTAFGLFSKGNGPGNLGQHTCILG